MSQRNYSACFEGLYIDKKLFETKQVKQWMHVHNEYEFLYILSGDVEHGIEERKYKLKKHDLVIVRPNDYHYIHINPAVPYERYDIQFDPDILGISNIQLIPNGLDVLNCHHSSIVQDIFSKIDYYYKKLPEADFLNVLKLLLQELIYNLNIHNSAKNTITPENIHPLVSRALTVINENLFTLKTIDEVADQLFVSKGYLFRMFKHEMKTTPLKYITEKRLHAAQSLLAQGKSPTHIYRECGFNDYTAFYRSYMKLFGHAPSE